MSVRKFLVKYNMVLFYKKNYHRSNVVPLKQFTRKALIWRGQDFQMMFTPIGNIVLEF